MSLKRIITFFSLILVGCSQTGRPVGDVPGERFSYTGGLSPQGLPYTAFSDFNTAEDFRARSSEQNTPVVNPIGETRQFRIKNLEAIVNASSLMASARDFLVTAFIKKSEDNVVFIEGTENFPGMTALTLKFQNHAGLTVFTLTGELVDTDGLCSNFIATGITAFESTACLIGNDQAGHLVFKLDLDDNPQSEPLWIEILPRFVEEQGPPAPPEIEAHPLIKPFYDDALVPAVVDWMKKWKTSESMTRYLDLYRGSLQEVKTGEYAQFAKMRDAVKANNYPDVITFVSIVESNFRGRKCSEAGACGFMQIMPRTAREWHLSWEQVRDPWHSMNAALKAYENWRTQFSWGNDLRMSFAAYNMGQYGFDKKVNALDAIPEKRLSELTKFSSDFWTLYQLKMIPGETRKYVIKIISGILFATSPEETNALGHEPVPKN